MVAAFSLAMVSCAGSGTSSENSVTGSDTSTTDSPTDQPSEVDGATTAPSPMPGNSAIIEGSSASQDVTTTEPAATAPAVERPTDPLAGLLFDIGAGVSTAPPEALSLDGAVLCNTSEDLNSLSNTAEDEELCFRNAIEMAQPAVLVVAFYTDEGDAIVRVQRTDSSSATIRVFQDSSQDAFAGMGASTWQSYECGPDQISRQTTIRSDTILSC